MGTQTMVAFEHARQLILEHITPLGSEPVKLLDALGRVLAEDVLAPWDMPLCNNTAMDGYAVRTADCQQAAELRITGYVPAGEVPSAPVEPGCAVKVMTGAPVPGGCDAIVPLEEAEESGDHVRITHRVAAGQHLRRQGEDIRCGETIIRSGTVIRPAEISVLASLGKLSVIVYRQARVAILSTGDELIEPGETPVPGKVVDCNSLSLAASVRQAGAMPEMLGMARDNPASHRAAISKGLQADALITSAGVSAGNLDLVRNVLEELGVSQVFWKVRMSPGGPMAFGVKDGTPVFSLPGNPVAALITFEEFVRPALLKLMGHTQVLKPLVSAVLQDEICKKPGKTNVVRLAVKLVNGKYLAYKAGNQNTGILSTTLKANALVALPENRTSFSPGEEIAVHMLSEMDR